MRYTVARRGFTENEKQFGGRTGVFGLDVVARVVLSVNSISRWNMTKFPSRILVGFMLGIFRD